MSWRRIVPLVVIGLVTTVAMAAAREDFKVVVNGTNSMNGIETVHLSKIFLKEAKTWPDGSETVPVDMAPDSSVRRKFSRVVHGRRVSAIKSFWQRQIFSGKAVPPVEFTSEEDLLFFVAETPGSVGYVSGSMPLIDGVKELTLTVRQ